jgi:hypothetical protein
MILGVCCYANRVDRVEGSGPVMHEAVGVPFTLQSLKSKLKSPGGRHPQARRVRARRVAHAGARLLHRGLQVAHPCSVSKCQHSTHAPAHARKVVRVICNNIGKVASTMTCILGRGAATATTDGICNRITHLPRFNHNSLLTTITPV